MTMRVVQVAAHGAADVLELVERPVPTPAAGQVAIRVSHAGVNFAEVMARRGDYHRAMPLPFVPGLEVAGQIEAVGDGVEDLRPGQDVVSFIGNGGYAEVALAPAALTFAYDAGAMAPHVAAAVPTIVPAAWLLSERVARLREGESVLVHSAAGGIGTVLGQLVRRRCDGLLIGTVGDAAKVDYARQFGYDEVVPRDAFPSTVTEQTGGRGVDAAFDAVGGSCRTASIAALAPLGRLIAFGNASREPETLPDGAELRAGNASVLGFSMGSLTKMAPGVVRQAIQRSIDLVTTKEVHIDVTEIIELRDVAQAHQRLESGTTCGKLVLRVAGS